ncbi:unnamed protein product [Cunninghamella blakesleeana]
MTNVLEYTPIDDISSIINEVRTNYKTGITKDLAFRKEQLKKMIQFFEENNAEFEKCVWSDLRKHRMEVLAETAPVVNNCKYLIENLDRLATPVSPKKHYIMNSSDVTYIRKEPKGVVLVIGSWNYPVHLLLMPVIGAIAAGNAVIIKPSEVAAHTAATITKLLSKYLDQRFYRVINGAAEETTKILENQLDHIFYTGGGTVGSIIMEKAAKHLTPVTLELGGKSPTYIGPDAINQLTANRISWGKFYNNGQTCVAPDYILVKRENAEELIKLLRKSITQFYSEQPEKSDSYGRIVNHRQFDRLQSWLDNVDPASIVIGGQSNRDDLFFAPTVVYPAPANGTLLMDNEIFGPILPIVPVDDVNEAIDVINSKSHPLVIYVFSNDKEETQKVINQTLSGGVLANDTLMHVVESSIPFGGVGPSGMGNYHGDRSFDTFTHERSTMLKSTRLESMMGARYPPYNDDKYNLFSLLINGLPSSFGDKVSTLKQFVGSSISVFWSSPDAKQENSKL